MKMMVLNIHSGCCMFTCTHTNTHFFIMVGTFRDIFHPLNLTLTETCNISFAIYFQQYVEFRMLLFTHPHVVLILCGTRKENRSFTCNWSLCLRLLTRIMHSKSAYNVHIPGQFGNKEKQCLSKTILYLISNSLRSECENIVCYYIITMLLLHLRLFD